MSLLAYLQRPVVPGSRLVGGVYRVPAEKLTDGVRRDLTLTPRSFQPQPPPPVIAYEEAGEEEGGDAGVPRFYGLARFGAPEATELCQGAPLPPELAFSGALAPDQAEAHDALVAHVRKTGGGLLVRKCGGGKTVIAIRAWLSLGVRAIVYVHKSFLLEQWIERIRQFAPEARVGFLQQDKVVVDDVDVCIAMIQSASSRDYDPAVFADFGLAIFDECHHMAAKTFHAVARKSRTRYVFGVTATLERPDGLTGLIVHSLGGVAHESAPEADDGSGSAETVVRVTRYEAPPGRGGDVKMRTGLIYRARMNDALSKDRERTALVAGLIEEAYLQGRHTLVLSDLIDLLDSLASKLKSKGAVPAEELGYYIGKTKPKERPAEAQKKVVLSTYSMAKEALDIPTLDCLVLAMPTGDAIEQCVGRIQRPCATKQTPLVHDVVDANSFFFQAMAAKRRRFYEARRLLLA